MTTYREMNLQRRTARPFYLELKSLGLNLVAYEDLKRPNGYQSLSTAHADRMRRRVAEHTPGLLKVL